MRSETNVVLQEYASKSAATPERSAAAINRELSAEPLQSLGNQDGTFINASISDIYKRHGITDFSNPDPGAAHGVPWFPFDRTDSFASLNAAFGMKAEKVESLLCPMVKTEPKSEPLDQQMESDHCFQAEQYTSTIDGGDGPHAGFDTRPLRAVASVVPTQLTSSAAELPADSRSDVSIPVSHFPPPLVPFPSPPPPATGQVLAPTLPFGNNMLNSSTVTGRDILPAILGAESRSSVGVDDDLSESEPEPDDGHCSPPPERVHLEAHRSRNAMYVFVLLCKFYPGLGFCHGKNYFCGDSGKKTGKNRQKLRFSYFILSISYYVSVSYLLAVGLIV